MQHAASPAPRWFESELLASAVLAVATLVALVLSNSTWGAWYAGFVHLPVDLRAGSWVLMSKPLLHWVNDFWMAIFFFLVGLEIKKELLAGELASPAKAALPLAAALGGMALPALIYYGINAGDALAQRGWAIPAATDIAFALGVLAILSSRVPASLKVFLSAVAILDDLGAIVVIALFYTDQLSLPMLAAAGAGVMVLLALNRLRVLDIAPYVVAGAFVWFCVLKSGVHATLAGVVTALAVPLAGSGQASPLERAEHALKPWVAFAILPMFAFVNAGVSLSGVTLASLTSGISLGVACGLVVGKSIGVFTACVLMIRWAGSSLPTGASYAQLFGVCVLCGIGFTMSLFIGSLAFEGLDAGYETQVKLGVLCGSALAGCLGVALLWWLGRDGPGARAAVRVPQ